MGVLVGPHPAHQAGPHGPPGPHGPRAAAAVPQGRGPLHPRHDLNLAKRVSLIRMQTCGCFHYRASCYLCGT